MGSSNFKLCKETFGNMKVLLVKSRVICNNLLADLFTYLMYIFYT